MELGFAAALVIAILVIVFPAALAWYLYAGNIMAVFKNKRNRQADKKAGYKSSLNGDIKK